MKTFKLLGLLITYPQSAVLNAADELLGVLRTENKLAEKSIGRIEHFLRVANARNLLELQEDYVDTFDRGRNHCLHLFEHIHGESRARGQAMVSLSEAYAAKGLYIQGNELPDYLPLFMEYLSHCAFDEARELLGEAIHVIAMIGAKLKKRQSLYADIFSAIETLSTVKPDKIKIIEAMANARKDPETLQALDEQWKEAAAFGDHPPDHPATDCGACGVSPQRPTSPH